MRQIRQRVRVSLANLLWFGYASIRARRWKRAASDVAGAQATVLTNILAANAASEFGREHRFADICSVEAYQHAVPSRSYEEIQPYIERITAGHPEVLTSQRVLQFGLTSGSTKGSKLIPYTQALVSEFQEGIDPWVHYLFRRFPRLLFGKTYWSVTPIGERKSHTAGGIPIGFDDEQLYFNPLTRWVLNSIMAGPSQLAQLNDMEVFRYVSLRLLLQERRLCWVSIWNPSFLTLLLDPLVEWLPELCQDIRQGTLGVAAQIASPLRESIFSQCARSPRRAEELERLCAIWQNRPATEVDSVGRTLYEVIWPNLHLISCWAHGNAALALAGLQACFPHAAIQPKGLLSTEAFISFPFKGDVSALSLLSHFFEFEEEEEEEAVEAAPVIRLAHELQKGRRYAVIVTTGGGLYRYRLNDVIEVADFYYECPLIRFIGRQSKVVDICGEKLNEDFICKRVEGLLSECALHPVFWMIAPECPTATQPFYTLFIQFEAGAAPAGDRLSMLAKALDEALQESYHFEYSRRLGQLERCRLFLIAPSTNGYHTYVAVCADLGQRLGEIKPTVLHAYQHWSERFTGDFVVQ
jgi:hypothetical protein